MAANSDTLYTALESEAIVAKGFDGDTLSRKPAGKAQHGRYQVNVYERGKDLEDTIKAFF